MYVCMYTREGERIRVAEIQEALHAGAKPQNVWVRRRPLIPLFVDSGPFPHMGQLRSVRPRLCLLQACVYVS